MYLKAHSNVNPKSAKCKKFKKIIYNFKNNYHSTIIFLCVAPPNMKALRLIMWAEEAHKENNKNGCHLKNIGQSDLILASQYWGHRCIYV